MVGEYRRLANPHQVLEVEPQRTGDERLQRRRRERKTVQHLHNLVSFGYRQRSPLRQVEEEV